jgi:hypothetical protein
MRNARGPWVVLLVALTVPACSTFDCAEACRRSPPICEPSVGLDCKEECETYLGTENCLSEGERLLGCFQENAGACTDGCDPDEPVPGCISGCEDLARRYERCQDP